MNFIQIRDFVCAKVKKNDSYSADRCMEYVKARDKMIYESFDWKAAQNIVDKTVTGAQTTVSVPELHHAISVRFDGKLLDPVSASFIFESATQTVDDYSTPGTPRYFDENLDLSTGTRKIRFFPPLANDSQNHALTVLGKSPYSDAWTSPAIPQTENALIAYATGDMLEYIEDFGKAQAKFAEGGQLLQAAQGADSPSALKARMSKVLTPNGNSLGEMTDEVCGMVGDWSPSARTVIKSLIRRNYQTLWDLAAWPETMVMATTVATGNTVVLPSLIDKVMGVRINLNAALGSYRALQYGDFSLYFGLQPQIFDLTGNPIFYSLLFPIALPVEIPESSNLKFLMTGSETAKVFIKGQYLGIEKFENVSASSVAAQTVNPYDVALTISKPVTKYSLQVQDLSGTILMELGPNEQERKHQRLQILPGFNDSDDQTVFVLAKRRIPQLMDSGDTCQLSSVENILINGAAADFLMATKPDVSAKLQAKAEANLKVLIDRETAQQAFEPRIIPDAEASSCLTIDDDFLG